MLCAARLLVQVLLVASTNHIHGASVADTFQFLDAAKILALACHAKSFEVHQKRRGERCFFFIRALSLVTRYMSAPPDYFSKPAPTDVYEVDELPGIEENTIFALA